MRNWLYLFTLLGVCSFPYTDGKRSVWWVRKTGNSGGTGGSYNGQFEKDVMDCLKDIKLTLESLALDVEYIKLRLNETNLGPATTGSGSTIPTQKPASDFLIYDGHSYLFVEVNDNFDQSEIACENVAQDAHLVIVNNIDEDNFIKEQINQGNISWWVGLTDRANEGTWVWLDGTPLPPSNQDIWFAGFTDASNPSGPRIGPQPNGGTFQNCAQYRDTFTDPNDGIDKNVGGYFLNDMECGGTSRSFGSRICEVPYIIDGAPTATSPAP